MRLHRLAALLLPLLLLGGTQLHVDALTRTYLCVGLVSDGALALGDAFSCNHFVQGDVLPAGTSRVADYTIPTDQRLVLEAWGVVILSAIGVGEQCAIELVTDNATLGAGSVVSTITTGNIAEAECTQGSITVDLAGEACTVNLSASVAGGGFWRFEWEDNDGGGANTCTAWQGGTVWLRGRLQPQ